MIKFIELFAGVGGFRYGLENANRKENRGSQENTQENAEAWSRLESEKREEASTEDGWGNEHPHYGTNTGAFTSVYSNEINEHASAIYKANEIASGVGGFRYEQIGEHDTRDIREVRSDEIPDHDLLTAGFPCQSFSIAGQRGGFEDTRGTLFFEVARILSEKEPKHFILENVKGILSHDGGRTFNTIIGVLSDLGYRCEWQVVNSKYCGLPQRRERVFIVGHLRGECSGRVFPLRRELAESSREDRLGNGVAVIHNIYGGFKEKMARIFSILPTLRTPKGGGHIPSLLLGDKNMYSVRKITPTEAERGQGFPDRWTAIGDYEEDGLKFMSNTQRYRAVGNAVSPPVITKIAEKMLDVCSM